MSEGEEAVISVSYTIADADGSDTAAATITITGVNDAPEAIDADLGTVSEDGAPVTFDALAAIVDVDSDPGDLSVLNVSASWNGVALTATLSNDVISFDPDQLGDLLDDGEEAEVTVTFDIADGIDATNGNMLTLTVTGADDEADRNLIEGTDGMDRLFGTVADETIVSRAGLLDVMLGGGGADVFVLSDETDNGVRETDYISDFGPDDVLEFGDRSIALELNGGGSTYIQLDGDGDRIVLVGGADYEGTGSSGSTSTRSKTYDDGRVLETTFVDGVRSTATLTDVDNAYAWSSRAQTFDADGDRVSRVVMYDDGRIVETIETGDDRGSVLTIDGADQFDWTVIDLQFDANELLSSRTKIYDDGRLLETTFIDGVLSTTSLTDLGDSYPWENRVRTYDADGDLIENLVTYEEL